MAPRKAKSDQLIVSWNVNGIRACAKKGFADWLAASQAHIVGLQEVRATPDQFPKELTKPDGWYLSLSPAQRLGYSGVGIYSKTPPDQVETNLGEQRFDEEGRVQIAYFGPTVIANIYFPNGSGKDRDNGRVPYKLDFYQSLFDRLQTLRAEGRRVLVMGDFNTAHRPIDLARPKSNEGTSGFLPEERAEIDRWLAAGWTDTFRHSHGDKPDQYTWWSQRGGARERNVGWRIDYTLACPAALPYVVDANIHSNVMGSDHCPISLRVSKELFRA